MLNGFGDFRVVQSKVQEAFKDKYRSTFPDYEPTRNDRGAERIWDGILGEMGVVVGYFHEDQLYRRGHMRIEDPMSEYIVTKKGTAVGKKHAILYVPEELAMKILVLGELP